MENNSANQLFIFISGHQGASSGNPSHYRLWDVDLEDYDFANLVQNYLLVDGVNNKTKFIYVMGSCAAWGFWDNLYPVTNTISFAAADDDIDFNTIDTVPDTSFMKYYNDAMRQIPKYSWYDYPSFDDAFNYADLMVVNQPIDDNPIKRTKYQGSLEPFGSGWDRFWSLDGDTPPAPPQNLQMNGGWLENPVLTWDANSEVDLSKYLIFRSPPDKSQFFLIDSTTNTTYTDINVVLGPPLGLWSYFIKAKDNAGHISAKSNTVSDWGVYKQITRREIDTGIPNNFYWHKTTPTPSILPPPSVLTCRKTAE